jgi:glycosyltransferase involved in cell wall biosynthesis
LTKLTYLVWDDGSTDEAIVAALRDAGTQGTCIFLIAENRNAIEELPDSVSVISVPVSGASCPDWSLASEHVRSKVTSGPVLLMAASERATKTLICDAEACEGFGQTRVQVVFKGRVLKSNVIGTEQTLRVCPAEALQFREKTFEPELVPPNQTKIQSLKGRVLRAEDMPLHELLERCVQRAQHASYHSSTLRWAEPARFPFAATLDFLWKFTLRGGFLDGSAGFHRLLLDANVRFIARTLTREQLRLFEHEPGISPPSDHSAINRVSCLILTKDEEINLEACLESLSFCDDIVVYDSYSTDATLAIANAHPCVRLIQRKFDNWSSHQNWGVENIEFKHPWVLYIDADERVSPDLAAEIQRVAHSDSPNSAFRMRRKDMFMGRWIRRASLYPTWLVRLFRPEKIRYERLINPVAVVSGDIGNLNGHLIHYPFSKGIRQWMDRHNSYSSFESIEVLNVLDGKRKPVAGIFSKDPNRRRAALKDVFYRLPLRPHIKYAYYMLIRLAFLDGQAGWVYARLQYLYEYMIAVKVKEELFNRRTKNTSSTQSKRQE